MDIRYPLSLLFLATFTCSAFAQSGYLRALELNTQSSQWEFVSFNLANGQTDVIAQIPDSLIPFGNGTVTTFNPRNQRYYFLTNNPQLSARYLVTLDAFSGKVEQLVEATGIFAIYANEKDGFIYGIRFITITQLVKISPTTGAVTSVTNNFNFVFGFSVNGSEVHAQNNEFWLVGQQPQNSGRLFRVNLNTGTVASIPAQGLRLVRRIYLTGETYGISRVSSATGFSLFTIDPADPNQQTVLEDSLPIQAISGEVCQINPQLHEMYLQVIQTGNPVVQLAVIDLNDGQIQRFIPFADKKGIAYTPFPPNQRTHTLSGAIYLDRNANGQRDSADIGMTNQRVDVQPGGYRVLTNASGRYSVQVPDGAYTITPFPTSQYYVSSQPTSYTISFQSGFGVADTFDFALAIVAGTTPKNDVKVSITPTPGRVGRDAQHTITIKNEGTSVLSGKVTYEEGAHMKVSKTSQPPSSVNNGTYEFEFTDLLPGESRQILVTVSTPPDPNLIGNSNTATVRVEAEAPDGTTATDEKTITQPIIGAYDPNDKLIFMTTDTTLAAGDTVVYRIRFQNVGNDTAFLVVIRDTLPIDQLDLESFTMDAASHHYFIQIEPDGHIAWTFPDILLPDSSTNQLGSNGFVEFRVRLKTTLGPGTVANRAGIYFDFNPPVITNDAVVTIPNIDPIDPFSDLQVKIYPNPGQDAMVVESALILLPPRVVDIHGQSIHLPVAPRPQGFVADTRQLSPGIYLIQLQAQSGETTWKRWVKY